VLLEAIVFVEEVGETGAGCGTKGLCSVLVEVAVVGVARAVYFSILLSSALGH
jgi:hypothetical protein